jgi:hypothetical protein
MSDKKGTNKPRYEPPVALPLGEMARGSGACTTGSVDIEKHDCSDGHSTGVECGSGTYAGVVCTDGTLAGTCFDGGAGLSP